MKNVLLSIATAIGFGVAASAGANEGGLALTRVFGGLLRDPVVAGDYVYVPGGRSFSAWNYADPAAPVFVAEADLPTGGIITGLTRWGNFLYASWYVSDDAGVAVYSIADPARPTLVNQFSDYFSDPYKRMWSIAATNGYLYLFDQENGIFRADLGPNPIHPGDFVRTVSEVSGIDYDRAVVHGNFLYASGPISFTASPLYTCAIYDVSIPGGLTPGNGGCGAGPHPAFFSARIRPPYAATFGLENFTLTDIADPANPATLGSTDAITAMDGFLHGDHAYGLGWIGIDILDVSNPAQPTLAAHSPLSLLGVAAMTQRDDGALVLTNTDRFVRLDVATTPLAPRVVSDVTPPGGAYAADVALVGDHVVFLQQYYGLGIAEAGKLTPLARFDADLPESLPARRMSDFVVDGNLVYLAAAQYGLIVVDLSDPLHPVERARLPIGGGELDVGNLTFALSGKTLFASRATFLGNFLQIIDVSDPAAPVALGAIGTGGSNRLQVRGKRLYIADDDGLVVYDIHEPTTPAFVTRYQGCDGLSPGSHPVYDIDLSDDGSLAYLACYDRLLTVDMRDPAHPQALGAYVPSHLYPSGFSVAVRGDRAWYGDGPGVHEVDVADPAAPAIVGTTSIGPEYPSRLRPLADGRLFAFTRISGIHVFGERAPDRIFVDGFDG